MKKSMLHKLLIILGVILSLTLLVCSCGGDTEPPANDPEEPETPDTSISYTVTVTNDANTPVEGVTVELFSGNTVVGTATTNASGVATVKVESEGLYTVKISKAGYIASESIYLFPEGSKALTAKINEDPNATYTVTVIDWRTQQPVVGVRVQLCVGDLCRLPVPTDENGVASVYAPKDSYTVKILTDDYPTDVYSFSEGSTELTVSLAPFTFDQAEGNTLQVKAGQTLYFMFRAGGATLNLVGSDVTVVHNGQTYTAEGGMVTIEECYYDGHTPSMFAVTNNGTATATYTINFLYPVGYMQNPAEVVIGTNSATTADNYYYAYTATAAGTFTVTIDPNCAEWSYVVHNLTTESYGPILSSADSTVVDSYSVTVAAGDVVQVIVAPTASDEVTVTFTAAFEAAQ